MRKRSGRGWFVDLPHSTINNIIIIEGDRKKHHSGNRQVIGSVPSVRPLPLGYTTDRHTAGPRLKSSPYYTLSVWNAKEINVTITIISSTIISSSVSSPSSFESQPHIRTFEARPRREYNISGTCGKYDMEIKWSLYPLPSSSSFKNKKILLLITGMVIYRIISIVSSSFMLQSVSQSLTYSKTISLFSWLICCLLRWQRRERASLAIRFLYLNLESLGRSTGLATWAMDFTDCL